MARPQKRTVDYFPHYATSGKTLLILKNEFGNDGYAFWFQLLSLLCRTDGQVYDYNNTASWRLLLAETSVSDITATEILRLLYDINAIDRKLYLHKIIWVQNLVDNLGLVYSRRQNGSKPIKPIIDGNNAVDANNNTQTKLNNTKLNKTTTNQQQNIFTFFEEHFELLKPYNTEVLKDYEIEYGDDKVLEALKIAVKRNKRNLSYVEGILKKGQIKKAKGWKSAE